MSVCIFLDRCTWCVCVCVHNLLFLLMAPACYTDPFILLCTYCSLWVHIVLAHSHVVLSVRPVGRTFIHLWSYHCSAFSSVLITLCISSNSSSSNDLVPAEFARSLMLCVCVCVVDWCNQLAHIFSSQVHCNPSVRGRWFLHLVPEGSRLKAGPPLRDSSWDLTPNCLSAL